MPSEKFSKHILVLFIISFFSYGLSICQSTAEKVELIFEIHQEQDIYDQSDYGEPPQFAIWLEDPENQIIKTGFVTYRTGTGKFKGKVECPLSLPIWIGIFRKETGRDDFPRPWKPFVDGVTGATPKGAIFEITVEVTKNIRWLYYIEMNVAGDHNKYFPRVSSEDLHDNHGNGQPSIIFKGSIYSKIGEVSMPDVIGRSDQHYFTTKINDDLEGIDTAKKVFSKIIVSCK